MSLQELESKFEINELFFSITDQRGRIESGNDIFIRVSEYSESELVNKPHNIIRHPDMPRVVFKYFWDELLDGRPIAAYVKNRSKTGKYYWVFAMAFPVSNGFLSIRIKPSTPILATVDGLYKSLIKIEKDGSDFDSSLGVLIKEIQGLGFLSYEDFISKALTSELLSRDALLAARVKKNPLNESLALLVAKTSSNIRDAFLTVEKLVEKTKILSSHASIIRQACLNVRYVATNLTISTSKLGAEGRPLGVISKNLAEINQSMDNSVVSFEKMFEDFGLSIQKVSFSIGVSRLQIEMIGFLVENSDGKNQTQLKQHMQSIRKLIDQNILNVKEELSHLIESSRKLIISIADLQKNTSGIDVIQIMGQIEIAKLQMSKNDLSSYLEEMSKVTKSFTDSLEKLREECELSIESDIQVGERISELTDQVSHMVSEASK